MSVDATRWAWMQPGLSPHAKLVLLAMADRADETQRCWPSYTRLMADTGIGNRRTISTAIKALTAAGLVEVDRDGQRSIYILQGVEDRCSPSAAKPPLTGGQKHTRGKIATSGRSATPTRGKTATTLVAKLPLESKRESKREPDRIARNDEPGSCAALVATPVLPVYELPLRSRSGEKPRTFPVHRENFETWQEAYPLVDVRAELKEIKAWLCSNPDRRPASSMLRFANAWLKRRQNDLASRQAGLARASPRPALDWTEREHRANLQDFDRRMQERGLST